MKSQHRRRKGTRDGETDVICAGKAQISPPSATSASGVSGQIDI